MLAIKNNLMAANAARHLGQSYQALATSVERLSSGLRINRASDDAAGLAVRELMRADIAVLQQGARNAQDGLSMLQTMEGGMQTIDDLLVRMTQLAEQAATGVYSQTQRSLMNNELSEIADGLARMRMSCAISKDDGETWQHFRNLESLDDAGYIEPEGNAGETDVRELAGQLALRGGATNANPPDEVSLGLGMQDQGASEATPETLHSMIDFLPEGCYFNCCATSAAQLPITTMAMIRGGAIRVGPEDNIYYPRGVLAPSNAQLAQRSVRIARELNTQHTTPAEDRPIHSHEPR